MLVMDDLSAFVPMDILVIKSRTAHILLPEELHMTLILTRDSVSFVQEIPNVGLDLCLSFRDPTLIAGSRNP